MSDEGLTLPPGTRVMVYAGHKLCRGVVLESNTWLCRTSYRVRFHRKCFECDGWFDRTEICVVGEKK